MTGVLPVSNAKNNKGHNNGQTKDEMAQEHKLVDMVLVEVPSLVLKDSDTKKIERVEGQKYKAPEN